MAAVDLKAVVIQSVVNATVVAPKMEVEARQEVVAKLEAAAKTEAAATAAKTAPKTEVEARMESVPKLEVAPNGISSVEQARKPKAVPAPMEAVTVVAVKAKTARMEVKKVVEVVAAVMEVAAAQT